MEKKEFDLLANEQAMRMFSRQGAIQPSEASQAFGFSEGVKWAYELLSKEETTINTNYQNFVDASNLLSSRFSKYNDDLKFAVDEFNDAVQKLSNKPLQ
jgi:hypothetical protein